MIPALVVLGILAGLPGTVATVHLSILAVGSLLFRERLPEGDVAALTFLVVIPAVFILRKPARRQALEVDAH